MVVLDVVEEILSRLLVKDLLRFKIVCKSWYSLISSPSFVKTHCKFMCNNEDINTRRIAMFSIRYTEGWSMEGSSNGLVCIYNEESNRIIVTNPFTGDFKELAKPPEHPRGVYERCLGFGYDSSTDDYKVVTTTCKRNITHMHVHILSLKSNIWKYFGQINYRGGDKRFDIDDSPLAAPGILFNGALHWFWHTWDEKVSLVSFDIAKEEFREIPQPDDSSYVWDYEYSLGIFEGSLCIFIDTSYHVDDSSDRIRVMKNCNGKPSWELLPITNYCYQLKDLAIHYMLKDSNDNRIPTYYCDDNIWLSSYEKYIASPIFVPTLVSPYVNNNNGIPSRTKNIRITRALLVQGVKEKRETEEEEKGVVTNTYKKGSKKKERLLKSFWKKKERVE